jgi:hypothetical protein
MELAAGAAAGAGAGAAAHRSLGRRRRRRSNTAVLSLLAALLALSVLSGGSPRSTQGIVAAEARSKPELADPDYSIYLTA